MGDPATRPPPSGPGITAVAHEDGLLQEGARNDTGMGGPQRRPYR